MHRLTRPPHSSIVHFCPLVCPPAKTYPVLRAVHCAACARARPRAHSGRMRTATPCVRQALRSRCQAPMGVQPRTHPRCGSVVQYCTPVGGPAERFPTLRTVHCAACARARLRARSDPMRQVLRSGCIGRPVLGVALLSASAHRPEDQPSSQPRCPRRLPPVWSNGSERCAFWEAPLPARPWPPAETRVL